MNMSHNISRTIDCAHKAKRASMDVYGVPTKDYVIASAKKTTTCAHVKSLYHPYRLALYNFKKTLRHMEENE